MPSLFLQKSDDPGPGHTELRVYSLFLFGVPVSRSRRTDIATLFITDLAHCILHVYVARSPMPSSLLGRPMRLRSFHLGCRNVSPVLMASKSDIKEEGGCDCLFLSCLRVESRPIHAAARHRPTTVVTSAQRDSAHCLWRRSPVGRVGRSRMFKVPSLARAAVPYTCDRRSSSVVMDPAANIEHAELPTLKGWDCLRFPMSILQL